jgi:hypothetical protein
MISMTALEDARRAAATAADAADRIRGELGEAAENVVGPLLREAGLTFAESWALISAIRWGGWNQGHAHADRKANV